MMDGFDQIQILLPKAHGLLYNSSSLNDSSLDSTDTRGNVVHNTLIILAYSILSAISLFGNTLVCYVIFKNKRLHTATNLFIANLALSDLLVTTLNVPFNIIKHILVEWPLGNTLCHLVTFSLMLSNYVSTFTLTAIALDRHRVVLKPLSPRMSKTMAAGILVVIWVIAILLSLPYGIYSRIVESKIVDVDNPILRTVRRCRAAYPPPSDQFHTYLTVTTVILQYCVPLTLIGVAYGRIVQSLWSRTHVGAVTANQQMSQARAKRKSIKLLIAVVVVFTLCWLPLILYHLLTTLHPNTEVFSYNINVYFACHWFAISSTCFNPFVYCWMNENFREEVKSRFRCCFRHPLKYLPGVKRAGLGSAGPRRQRQDTSITRSSVRSSANMHSVRRDVTLLSEQEDMMSHKQSDGFMVAESAERDEEVQDLLSMYGNGRVEYHISSAHNCIKG